MTESAAEPTLMATTNLLTYYNFQDESQSQEQLLARWLQSYPTRWVRLALIEALYQGRYKSISVELLLQLWQRRGQPIYHFNGEFESLVCHNVPQTFMSLHSSATGVNASSAAAQPIPTPQTAATEPQLAPIKSLRQRSFPSRPAVAAHPQAESPTVSVQPPSVARTALPEPDRQPMHALAAATAAEQPQTTPAPNTTAVSVEQQQPPESTDAPPTEHVTLNVDDPKLSGTQHGVDWLTAELEMAAIENVQALVTKHAQRTGPMASPISHFTPTAPATGLYTRLAAIANTQ